QAEGTVDASNLATTGRATVKLTFTTEAPLRQPFAVRLELRADGRTLQQRDHTPPVPVMKWQANVPVSYELPLFFPLTPKNAHRVDVLVGFLNPEDNKVQPPLSRTRARDGMVQIATFDFPKIELVPDTASVEAA